MNKNIIKLFWIITYIILIIVTLIFVFAIIDYSLNHAISDFFEDRIRGKND